MFFFLNEFKEYELPQKRLRERFQAMLQGAINFINMFIAANMF